MSLDDSLEHLWVDVKGKNKKLPYLIGVFYLVPKMLRKLNAWKKFMQFYL